MKNFGGALTTPPYFFIMITDARRGRKAMDLTEKLRACGQEHLLDTEGLSEAEREAYLCELAALDLTVPAALRETKGARGKIGPAKGLSIPEIEERGEEYRAAGREAIRGGKVAAVLLAGGQGTRLGFDRPKGTFNMGTKRRPRYIFQLLIENLLGVCEQCGAFVPLFIMTSEKNDAATREFLKEHAYFGYPEKFIRFFVQEMYPCTDFGGKILLEARGKIALSPNGNGGWFSSLKKTDIAKEFPAVEWYNVFGVDNVLQKIADPAFVGATILSGTPCGVKYVRKKRWKEHVGVLCIEDGAPSVIEYYELPEELAKARDGRGGLLYSFGMTLNYLFSARFLDEVSVQKIPLHAVKKVIPCLDAAGNTVVPKKPNGYKFETLILDMVRLAGDCLPYEVERSEEFAPVKNKRGRDSVRSAKRMLWLKGKL